MAMNQAKSIKRILSGAAVIAVIGSAAWVIADWFHEQQTKRLTDANVQEIIAMLNLTATPDFHQQVDKVRTFINDNSIHKIDEAFWSNQGNAAAFAAGLIAHAKKLSSVPVHMECSTRSNLMKLVLQALGYQTRIIAIFNSRTNLRSHSFLEVMNPDTGRWETQDPDYDIYWRSKKSAERVSLAEMAEAVAGIEPCGRESCGWQHASREGMKAKKLMNYLDIISISEKQKVRYTLYTSRADLGGAYIKGQKRGAFCQVEAKRCKHGFVKITEYSTFSAGLPR